MYGPVRTVVWEGRSCEAPPYPDQSIVRQVISVPTDNYLSSEDIARLRTQTIEHAPQALAPIEQAERERYVAPEISDREFEPQTERERRLLAELEALEP